MLFLKRQLPLVVAFVTGMMLIGQYYVPHRKSEEFYTNIQTWIEIVAAFALFMGGIVLLQLHLQKMMRRQAGWGYSAVLVVSFLGTIGAGVLAGGSETKTGFGWSYEFLLTPLQGTMFALLAFFIASAAFRAFRAKTFAAGLLLSTAIVIMFASVPLGDYIWTTLTDWLLPTWAPWSTDTIRDWLLNVANVAGKRAILFGVSLGVIATSLRVIFGIERAYLGGD